MAKIHAVYDTNSKELSCFHDNTDTSGGLGKDGYMGGKTTGEKQEDIQHLEFHKISDESGKGPDKYELTLRKSTMDDAHDTQHVHTMRASKDTKLGIEPSKIHIEYDTKTKGMEMKHGGKKVDNVHHVEIHHMGKDKDGADQYEMHARAVEHDATNDAVHVHQIHAKKYEDNKVAEKAAEWLTSFANRKNPKEIKKSGQI